jgi:hypothetical protein
MEQVQAPPEASLIRLARQAANIRMAAAAAEAGISLARWSHIENGHETRMGIPKRVRAKADTLARMAGALSALGAAGLSPERLETEGQRPDAAEILREMLRPSSPLRIVTPPPGTAGHADPDAADEDAAASIIPVLVAKFGAGENGDGNLDAEAVRVVGAQLGHGRPATTILRELKPFLRWMGVGDGEVLALLASRFGQGKAVVPPEVRTWQTIGDDSESNGTTGLSPERMISLQEIT